MCLMLVPQCRQTRCWVTSVSGSSWRARGRFDLARTVKQRAAEGLGHESMLMTEDFLALTLDISGGCVHDPELGFWTTHDLPRRSNVCGRG